MAVWIGRWERRRKNSIVSTWIRGSRLFLRSLVGEALNEIFKAQTAERKSDVHRPQRPQRKPSSSTVGRINVGVLCSAKHTYVQVCAYYINTSGGGEDVRLPSQRPLTETFFKHLKAWNHRILLDIRTFYSLICGNKIGYFGWDVGTLTAVFVAIK